MKLSITPLQCSYKNCIRSAVDQNLLLILTMIHKYILSFILGPSARLFGGTFYDLLKASLKKNGIVCAQSKSRVLLL